MLLTDAGFDQWRHAVDMYMCTRVYLIVPQQLYNQCSAYIDRTTCLLLQWEGVKRDQIQDREGQEDKLLNKAAWQNFSITIRVCIRQMVCFLRQLFLGDIFSPHIK